MSSTVIMCWMKDKTLKWIDDYHNGMNGSKLEEELKLYVFFLKLFI